MPVMSLDRWGMLLWSILGRGNCLCSEDWNGDCATDRTVRKGCLVSYTIEAVEWAQQLPEFSGWTYQMAKTRYYIESTTYPVVVGTMN